MRAHFRTIAPSFYQHAGLFQLGERLGIGACARVAYEGLWTYADREGRFEWKPDWLKLNVLPFDSVDFAEIMDALESEGFIVSYIADGRKYGWIPRFTVHQHINSREEESRYPIPPADTAARAADASLRAGLGKGVDLRSGFGEIVDLRDRFGAADSARKKKNIDKCEVALNSDPHNSMPDNDLQTPSRVSHAWATGESRRSGEGNGREGKGDKAKATPFPLVASEGLSADADAGVEGAMSELFGSEIANSTERPRQAVEPHAGMTEAGRGGELPAAGSLATALGMQTQALPSIRGKKDAAAIIERVGEVLAGVAEGTRRRLTREQVLRVQSELLFAYWAKRMGHENAIYTAARELRIVKRLKENGGDVSELCFAVDGALKDDNLMGRRNDRPGVKYDGIETIFRDRGQVERLVALSPKFKPGALHSVVQKYLAVADPNQSQEVFANG